MTRRASVAAPSELQERMTEKAMTETIAELAALKGYRMWHIRDSSQSPEMIDFPDLVLLSPDRVFFIELKSQKRAITIGQRMVAELLKGPHEFIGGIVRPTPYPGEMSFDEFLERMAE